MLQEKQNNFRPAKRLAVKPVKKTASVASRKASQHFVPTNCIRQLINGRGFKSIVPTDEVLQTLDMTIHRFNKILDNKVELTLNEANGFANWLGVTIEELTPVVTGSSINLSNKYGLEN